MNPAFIWINMVALYLASYLAMRKVSRDVNFTKQPALKNIPKEAVIRTSKNLKKKKITCTFAFFY